LVEQAVRETRFLDPIVDLLAEVETRMLMEAENQQPDLQLAFNHLLTSGGKRIRPAITLLCGGGFGGDWKHLVTLSAAIELLHTATLVHDDLIDGALLRRGIATLNAQWTPAATVLTGDFIFARAANLAAETESVKVMQLFANTLATIVNGEINQLFYKKVNLELVDYEKRIYAKTASLFELATVASALLSPVTEDVIQSMHLFGKNMGMAFQIIDDILDFTGSAETVGKPVGSDLRQGLITAPAIFFLQETGDFSVLEGLENYEITDETVNLIIEGVRQSGAIDQSFEYATRFINQSRLHLASFPEGIYKRSLSDLIDFIIDRRV